MSKDAVLTRIRAAKKDVPEAEMPEDVVVARDYLTDDGLDEHARLEQFCERVAEYKVTVVPVARAELTAKIREHLQARGISRLVIPADIPADWLPEGIEVLRDENGALDNSAINTSDGVLTGCALGIAQTGTIVLDGGDKQGRRVLTLLPDYHLCVIDASQVVGLVPAAMKALEPAVRAGRPITLVSGPSATSDIELNRVEGVHGPRTLELLVVS
jgi:L-lactate dehydrogenase complex protein LldG